MADDILLGNSGDDIQDTGDNQTSVHDNEQNSLSSIFGEYANNPSIQKFKSPEAFAKSYIELEKLVGKKAIQIPEDENGLVDALNKLGVPEAPDKYPDVEGYEQVFEDNEELQAFKELAHKAHLLPKQYEKIMSGLKEIIQQDLQQTEEQKKISEQQALATLQKEWGSALNEKLIQAQKFAANLPVELQQKIISTGLNNDPDFIKFVAEIAENYSEGKIPERITMTPQEAKSELESILNDKQSPYFDKYHPQHKAMVEKVNNLYQQLNTEE